MMVWYHVSQSPDFPAVLSELREPGMAYGESNTPRTSVAPSISQCLVATSFTGVCYVQTVDVVDPEVPDSTVGDVHMTAEKWITQAVLDRHGGKIFVSSCGTVNLTHDALITLKLLLRFNPCPDGIPNEDKFWTIDSNGHRILRPGDQNSLKRIMDGGDPVPLPQLRPKPSLHIPE